MTNAPQVPNTTASTNDWHEGMVVVLSSEMGVGYVLTKSGDQYAMSSNFIDKAVWDQLIPASSLYEGTTVKFKDNGRGCVSEIGVLSQPQIDTAKVHEGEIDALPMGIGNLSGAGGPGPHVFTSDDELFHIFNHESGALVQLFRPRLPALNWPALRGMVYDENDKPIPGTGTRMSFKMGADNTPTDVQIVAPHSGVHPEDMEFVEGEILILGTDANSPEGGLIYAHNTRKLYEFNRAAVADDVWPNLKAKPLDERSGTDFFGRGYGTKVAFRKDPQMQAYDLKIVGQPIL